jgi:hypothetical protein
VDWCRRTFEQHLDPSLDGATQRLRLAQIVAVCDATTWRILRADGGLTAAETATALRAFLAPLLP